MSLVACSSPPVDLGEPVSQTLDDGSTRSGYHKDGLRVGRWEELWPNGRLRMFADYQLGRLQEAAFYTPERVLGLRFQRQQAPRGGPVVLIEAFDEQERLAAALRSDGSAPHGNVGLLQQRMEALVSPDAAQAMTLASIPVGPWQLGQAFFTWTNKQLPSLAPPASR